MSHHQKEPPTLTPQQIEDIAERAAELAIAKVYTQIGQSFVQKALYVIGAVVVAILMTNGPTLLGVLKGIK
jgi:hypothetical protein